MLWEMIWKIGGFATDLTKPFKTLFIGSDEICLNFFLLAYWSIQTPQNFLRKIFTGWNTPSNYVRKNKRFLAYFWWSKNHFFWNILPTGWNWVVTLLEYISIKNWRIFVKVTTCWFLHRSELFRKIKNTIFHCTPLYATRATIPVERG